MSFQHKDTIQNGLKRNIMASGSGGDFVHCEIVLNELSYQVCSSWHPEGVSIRPWTNKIHPTLWHNYDLGSVDHRLLAYFNQNKGTPYTLTGLLVNMYWNANVPTVKSFCSQICYEAIVSLNTYNLPKVVATAISPQDLKNIFDKHNFSKLNTSWL